MSVTCSCGVDGCRELGWPHEWDPIAAGDTCTITPPPMLTFTTIDDDGQTAVRCYPPSSMPHRVTEPYARWGSGYACLGCIELHGDQYA